MRPVRTLLLLAMLFVPACAQTMPATELNITANRRISEPLPQNTRYKWIGAACFESAAPGAPALPNVELDQRIRRAVEKAMLRKNFYVSEDDPRLLGIYAVNADERTLNIIAENNGVEDPDISASSGLTLIFADSETHKIIFVGTADAANNGRFLEIETRALDQAARRLVDDLAG